MSFDYSKHRAHPTKYKGVQFRSRLEAKWACFFDLTHAKWQYEPMDLNGWSPDFQVSPSWTTQTCAIPYLIEVKPIEKVQDFRDVSRARYHAVPDGYLMLVLGLRPDALGAIVGVLPIANDETGTVGFHALNNNNLSALRGFTGDRLKAAVKQLWDRASNTVQYQYQGPA